jgi:ubiquinone/menaquinone biosynthesis C-methylase UbiE
VIENSRGRRIYDRWARHPHAYDVMTRLALLGRRERLRRSAIERLGLRRGDRVLDLACGSGPNLEPLTRAVGAEGSVVALDYSPGMLEGAARLVRSRGWRNVELRLADAARVELAPGSLDGALCTLALSAIPGHREASRRIRRALQPGAAFVVLDATLFPGPLRFLNPLIGPIFGRATNWDYEADLIAELRAEFDEIQVERLNLGSCFIATARRAG